MKAGPLRREPSDFNENREAPILRSISDLDLQVQSMPDEVPIFLASAAKLLEFPRENRLINVSLY
jgi:hypothetical protein